jgi:hypothetical protein
MSLSAGQDALDIEAQVADNITRLANEDRLEAKFGPEAVARVAESAKCSFLWACQLLKYLQSPQLSPNERQIMSAQSRLLEGPDCLYRLILVTLEQKGNEDKAVVADVFCWLTASISQLSLPMFPAVLSIRLGRLPTDRASHWNWPKSYTEQQVA